SHRWPWRGVAAGGAGGGGRHRVPDGGGGTGCWNASPSRRDRRMRHRARPPVSLPQALHDPKLLAPVLPSPAWGALRRFRPAVAGLPLTGKGLDLYRACTGREQAPKTPAREAWVIAGRRSGKSRIASAIATYIAALADVRALAPGETGVVYVCASDKEQAGV